MAIYDRRFVYSSRYNNDQLVNRPSNEKLRVELIIIAA